MTHFDGKFYIWMGNRFMHYIDKSDSAEEGTVSQIIFGYYSLT